MKRVIGSLLVALGLSFSLMAQPLNSPSPARPAAQTGAPKSAAEEVDAIIGHRATLGNAIEKKFNPEASDLEREVAAIKALPSTVENRLQLASAEAALAFSNGRRLAELAANLNAAVVEIRSVLGKADQGAAILETMQQQKAGELAADIAKVQTQVERYCSDASAFPDKNLCRNAQALLADAQAAQQRWTTLKQQIDRDKVGWQEVKMELTGIANRAEIEALRNSMNQHLSEFEGLRNMFAVELHYRNYWRAEVVKHAAELLGPWTSPAVLKAASQTKRSDE